MMFVAWAFSGNNMALTALQKKTRCSQEKLSSAWIVRFSTCTGQTPAKHLASEDAQFANPND